MLVLILYATFKYGHNKQFEVLMMLKSVIKFLAIFTFFNFSLVGISFASSSPNEHPLKQIFVEELASGNLQVNSNNQGTLTVHVPSEQLVNFIKNSHKNPVNSHYNPLADFTKQVESKPGNYGLNTVLVLDNNTQPHHEDIYTLELKHPVYNAKTQEITYDASILQGNSTNTVKNIKFHDGVLLVLLNDGVCLSCY